MGGQVVKEAESFENELSRERREMKQINGRDNVDFDISKDDSEEMMIKQPVRKPANVIAEREYSRDEKSMSRERGNYGGQDYRPSYTNE